ncbi:MAG: YihY/virulence factor BrkB family protein [Mogibacterium diversum]|jgi:hypothetical protein|nr:YihY/virulence factor BrkB family protein [Mogibacterium diversum]
MNKETENKSNINIDKEKKKKVRLNKDNFIKIVFHIFRQFDDQYYAGFAAQVAYYFFMASVPTLIVLSQVLGVFDLSLDIIKNWLNHNVDSQLSGFVMGLFSASSVRLGNFIMIFLALWSASALEFSLSRLTSYTLTEGAYKFNFFAERLKAVPAAAITIFAVAFTLVVFVYGEDIFYKLFNGGILARALIALKLPIVAISFFAMITLNYYILPLVRVPIRAILPGAVFSSFGLLIATTIYANYISYSVNYDILYGAFASIVALMLWFYIISWILCVGMMFNKAWDEVMQRNRLSHEKMIEYIEKKSMLLGEEKSKRYIISGNDNYGAELETIAVKLSRKFVKGYEEELRKEKQRKAHRKL